MTIRKNIVSKNFDVFFTEEDAKALNITLQDNDIVDMNPEVFDSMSHAAILTMPFTHSNQMGVDYHIPMSADDAEWLTNHLRETHSKQTVADFIGCFNYRSVNQLPNDKPYYPIDEDDEDDDYDDDNSDIADQNNNPNAVIPLNDNVTIYDYPHETHRRMATPEDIGKMNTTDLHNSIEKSIDSEINTGLKTLICEFPTLNSTALFIKNFNIKGTVFKMRDKYHLIFHGSDNRPDLYHILTHVEEFDGHYEPISIESAISEHGSKICDAQKLIQILYDTTEEHHAN